MADSNPLSKLVDFPAAYRAGMLHDFFAVSPGQVEKGLSLPRKQARQGLSLALRRYAKASNAPQEVFKQLDLLAHPNSRAVVTGQQAGLLLGPSYTLSKAVTALQLAKEVSTDERPVVAVFWVASQDHDTAEIDHANLLDFAESLTKVQIDLPVARPAGRIPFENGYLKHVKEHIAAQTFKAPFVEEVTALLAECSEGSIADVFSRILYRLLGRQGLIVLNPMEPDIAPLFAPVLEAEIANPLASSKAINEAATRLVSLGLDPQLGRGKLASNLFLEQDGRRQLLRVEGKRFFTEVSEYTKEDLLEVLASEPARITPAAGLRPICQDALLPTAMTVVGPGELRYFAQLKGVYEYHSVAMPLIWPRASATLIEPPVQRIMDKFDLDYNALSKDFPAAKAEALFALHGHAQVFNEALTRLDQAILELVAEVKHIDPSLMGSLQRGEGYIKKTLEIFKQKSALALEKQDDIYSKQFERLSVHLFPNGGFQERVISPFSFFLKFGIDPVMAKFLSLPSQGHHLLAI